jgi:hypothetical protein
MLTLPKTIQIGENKLKQICREGNYAIYKMINRDSYEVIRIKKLNNTEYYPPSNSWSVDGFTCTSKEDAYERLEQMIKAAKKLNK